MALRISREQTATDLPPDDTPMASLPSVKRILDAPDEEHEPPPDQAQDPPAEMGDDDVEDDLDVPGWRGRVLCRRAGRRVSADGLAGLPAGGTGLDNLTLARKEGWQRMVQAPARTQPESLSAPPS
jgi:hypothetical protein